MKSSDILDGAGKVVSRTNNGTRFTRSASQHFLGIAIHTPHAVLILSTALFKFKAILLLMLLPNKTLPRIINCPSEYPHVPLSDLELYR